MDREWLSALLQGLATDGDDAVVLADLRGIILFVNRAASRLLGYLPAELEGERLARLEPSVQAGGKADGPRAVAYRCKDGRWVHGETVVTTLRDGAGRAVARGAVIRDAGPRAREVESERAVREQLSRQRDWLLRRELAVARRAAPVAASAPMADALQALQTAATKPGSILLIGEPGVGKRRLALHAHLYAGAAPRPLIELDGSAPPDDPELTAAPALAAGGTLLLRRVDALPPPARDTLRAALATATGMRVIATSRRDPFADGG
ncbi:MAG: PAS domain S-box protein, partial [Myxococcales bacterium]